MTDSDPSITRSSVSRRSFLMGATATPLVPGATLIDNVTQVTISLLWEKWHRLRKRALSLCHRWQDLETHLMRTIGVPQVVISLPGNSAVLRAFSHAEIDRALSNVSSSPEVATALHDEFANQQARWDAEALRLGFNEVKRQEDEAWRQEAEACAAIFRAQATSLSGIEIKIALIIELCSAGSEDPDFPLPQLLSTLGDVKCLIRERGLV